MTSRLAFGFAIATMLGACVPPTTGGPAPRPLKPQDGPRATIHVDHSGGAFLGHIRTRFRLDRSGYAMVGHLGGDGQIRVLYPQTPYSSGWVAEGKTISLKPVNAMYDLAPYLFSFARPPYRTSAAMYDSYDGRGHGYVFIITSRYPIYLGAVAADRAFETLHVQEYDRESDPRVAIRELADDLTTGPYSLTYATNDGPLSRYSLASTCAYGWALSSYDPYFGPWSFGFSFFDYPGNSIVNGLAFAHYYGFGRSCGGSHYVDNALSFRRYSTIYNPVRPAAAPRSDTTPDLERPKRRSLENPDRGRGPLMSGFGSFGRRTGFDLERGSRRPVGGRPQSPVRARDRGLDVTGRANTDIHRPGRGSRPVETPRSATPSTATPVQPPAPTAHGDQVKAERPKPPQ